jgi:hypothetical protein
MGNVPPTLLSTFEVLFTPQLPPFGPPVVTQAVENVVKGYFLTISNPNPNPYTFDIGFHCNVNPSPTPPSQRTLASAVGFIDDGTTGNPLTISSSSATDFSVSVTVSANGTVLVGILPAFFTMSGLAAPTIEARGWVDITLPALFRKFPAFGSSPQSSSNVPILVTPEQRLTFLPVSGDVSTAVEAQAAFALPLATGASMVSVPPQPGISIIHPLPGKLQNGDAQALKQLLSASPEIQRAALAALLADAEPSPAGVSGD